MIEIPTEAVILLTVQLCVGDMLAGSACWPPLEMEVNGCLRPRTLFEAQLQLWEWVLKKTEALELPTVSAHGLGSNAMVSVAHA
jgi:hypothetical protein